jgi:hypothetical protein
VLFAGAIGHWSPSGHILIIRADGALLAAPFDERTLEAGPAAPLLEGIQVEVQASADFAISRNGTLVYAPGGIQDAATNQVVWVDRAGNATPVDAEWTGDYGSPRLSPDGRYVALERQDQGEFQVWIKELDDGPEAKLTFQGTDNFYPAWTADGREVAYVATLQGVPHAFVRRADAAVPAERLVAGDTAGVQEIDFSPDGGPAATFSDVVRRRGPRPFRSWPSRFSRATSRCPPTGVGSHSPRTRPWPVLPRCTCGRFRTSQTGSGS